MLATKPKIKTNHIDNRFNHKIYWLDRLSGELPQTKITPDYIAPLGVAVKDRAYEFNLPLNVSQQIIEFTYGSNLAIYGFLLTCLKVLLQKYTDNREVIIGSPSYCDLGAIESRNTVIPLRSEIAKNITFKSFLLEVKDTLTQAYLHQNCDFAELNQILDISKDNQFSSFYRSDIIFGLENIHDLKEIAQLNKSLTLTCAVKDNKITSKIEYSDLLFQEQTIELLSKTYVNIIEQTINNVSIKVADINLLTPTAEKQLLLEFNQNTQEYPVTNTIAELFAEQVKQTPDSIAAIAKEACLTYQELNERANQIARLLFDLGIKPGEFVGIYQKRNLNFIVAILATLKAGAVYVPLDSTYPTARINYAISDSQVRFLLTDAEHIDRLIAFPESHSHLEYLISLDTKPSITTSFSLKDCTDWQNLSTENLEITQTGIDPAYVIYTSGSTGKPKGTIIRHGGAINHIYAQYDALNLGSNLTFLQSAPASSDISVWQFLAPILIGGKTVIIDTETICNPEQLFRTIQEHQINLVELVPVVLKSLLNYLSSLPIKVRELSCLQWMMVTGESVSVALVNDWLKLYPNIPIVNAYGPSEASDDITQAIIDKPLPDNTSNVPIGKPLPNLNLYILDRNQNLLPVGVPGEICVSGYGVGIGYWQNEEKTRASFILNPFPQTAKPLPGVETDLLYKTGDLGRWLHNGSIEYLGRIDNQVKIRGFRIELGEIEAQLRQHPEVEDCVVIAREDISEHKRLVAYIVSRVDSTGLTKELRSFLQQKLPEYMLPSLFMALEKLPLTPSGKIDRNSLPALPTVTADANKTIIKPRTNVEEVLVNIWQEVLGIEAISIYDNFFELGGDSILCIQAIAKAHQQSLNLTFKQMFEQQTIANLAEVVNQTATTSAEQGVLTGEVLLTPIQQYVLEQNLANPHHWNEAVLLEVREKLDRQFLTEAIQALLLHHDALRLKFEPTQSSWQGFYQPPQAATPFVYADLSHLSLEQQNSTLEVTANELQQSLNLSQGDNLKVAWFDLGKQRNSRLLVIIHHLVVDSISWRILLEDLQTAYQQAKQGQTITLPPKTASLRQWTQQLQEYANSQLLQSELDYWLAESHQDINSLPVDYPDAVNTEASAKTLSRQFSATETQLLLQEISTLHRIQINDLLLISLAKAITEWTGDLAGSEALRDRKILIDLENHGREEIGANENIDTSRTVGLLSSIFPVYLDLQLASNLEEVLKTLKEQLRDIPNKGVGYGILRYLSKDPQVKQSLAALPQAEIAFNYLGQFDRTFGDSSLFQLASESIGEETSGENQRSHLLSFGAFIVNSQLEINCTYSNNLHSHKTIESLLQTWLKVLQEIIHDSQSSETESLIPSDFPLIELNQDQLDSALGMVEF